MSKGPFIAPGFIDIQVNGYRRHDYSGRNLVADDVLDIVHGLAAAGVTQHLPTIITNPADLICRNLSMIAATIERSPQLETCIPGIHVEGPFICPLDGPRGAHARQHVRDPDIEEFKRWQDSARGRIRMVTLAPERPGALRLIETLRQAGVIPAIGHTAARPEDIRSGIDAGAMISTHLGNGSHALLPRHNNYLWEQMASDSLRASIVADGFHLPPALVKTLVRAKGLNRLVLVSDVAPLAGSKPGRYSWGDSNVDVYPDGHLGLADTEFLAGAGHLLDRSIVQIMDAAGVTIGEAVSLCTVNPRGLLGLPHSGTSIGSAADLAVFELNPATDHIEVSRTIAAGTLLYQRDGEGVFGNGT